MPSYYDRRNVDDHWLGGKQNDVMNGNGGNDYIRGGGGDDRIYGGIGNDQLYGDDGKDFLQGNEGTDLVDGGAGNDTLYGGAGNDSVDGGAGNDAIHGDDGNDTMHGGIGDDELGGEMGADTMWGDVGSDAFYWFTQAESNAANGVDTIQDYNSTEDHLWFQPEFDANATLAGRQHWEFVGTDPTGTALADGNGQATIQFDGTYTTVNFYNNDGDFTADMTIRFAGNVANPQFMIWVDGSPSGSFSDPAILY
jgi:Ca2+-binding RTX toxin-like protein